jgi:hypothetical protein
MTTLLVRRRHVLAALALTLTPAFTGPALAQWSGWREVSGGGFTSDAPAVVTTYSDPQHCSWSDDSLQLLVRGYYENDIWNHGHEWGVSTHSWTDLTGFFGVGPTPSGPAATFAHCQTFWVWRGFDDAIQMLYYLVFKPFPVPDGSTRSAPAVTALGDRVYLFVRGYDDAIYQNIWNITRPGNGYLPAGYWTGWSYVPGYSSTPSAPAATVLGDQLYLFHRGNDNAIYQNILGAGGWSGWSAVPGGGLTYDAPGAATACGRVHLLVRGTDNTIQINTLAEGVWSGWSAIPGGWQTPSAPAGAEYPQGGWMGVFIRGMDNRIYGNGRTCSSF